MKRNGEFGRKVQRSHYQRFWECHDRDSYTCPMCGYEAQGLDGEFNVHHIDGDWLNGHLINLVAICYQCHRRTHRLVNRQRALDEWKKDVPGNGVIAE